MIHPSAIVHPKAEVHPSVQVGPYAIIDEKVKLGANCIVDPYAYLTGITSIGQHNHFFAGCVIGEAPQDLKYDGSPSALRIGDHNRFREHATVHRSAKAGEETVIGSHNLLMAGSHVAHDCRLGNYIIMVNGSMLAGHVIMDDHAIISGSCLVHQFVHIGTFALMQGGAAISKDLPPYTVARGVNKMCGLNTVGLRRAGFTPAQRLELKQLYRALFRTDAPYRTALAEAQKQFSSPTAKVLLDFLAGCERGFCADTGRSTTEDED